MNKLCFYLFFFFSFCCFLFAGEDAHFDLTGKWREGCAYSFDWKSAVSREVRINLTGIPNLHPFRKDTAEIAFSGVVTVDAPDSQTCSVRNLTVWRNGIKKTYSCLAGSQIKIRYMDGKCSLTKAAADAFDAGAAVLSGKSAGADSPADEREGLSILQKIFQKNGNDEAGHLLACRKIDFSQKGEKKAFVPVAIISALMDRKIDANPENVSGVVEYTGSYALAKTPVLSLKVKAQTVRKIPGYDFKYKAVLSYPGEQAEQCHGPVKIEIDALETVSNVIPSGGMFFAGERIEITTREMRSVNIEPVKK